MAERRDGKRSQESVDELRYYRTNRMEEAEFWTEQAMELYDTDDDEDEKQRLLLRRALELIKFAMSIECRREY